MPEVERTDSEEHHLRCQGEDSESPLGGGLHCSGLHQVTGTALKGEPMGLRVMRQALAYAYIGNLADFSLQHINISL